MKIVGLTGGIGSGKTTVAKMFQDLGVPLYIADERAKILMNTSKDIKKQLITLFGDEAYNDKQLNRPFLASKIFKNPDLLKQMNAIVHPKVGDDFTQWKGQQTAPYVLKEAAIIFENDLASHYDFIITVVADLDQRLARVMKRDSTTEDKIMAIVNNQLTDDEKAKQSDFVITNHDLDQTKDQVLIIHQHLLQTFAKN
ncbi:dephospho-CoA kinase [Gelidibacter algens]|jgi:dephospho-CoA kinase|uniref:Dephospho-CoA kinase n=1 Tax=Gelidibacter algens TaxID=49280 RepID=A0A1A7R430_9FLAO|nr:dephospho-CoA kinase [Gelidibacter algens]OBX26268.1 dephospho-CoA kinase [Gelidibacter algens]RAJ24850.1 dephospho-CoA kinase [Gelidibacter algens]